MLSASTPVSHRQRRVIAKQTRASEQATSQNLLGVPQVLRGPEANRTLRVLQPSTIQRGGDYIDRFGKSHHLLDLTVARRSPSHLWNLN
jgi:hypothetical protein